MQLLKHLIIGILERRDEASDRNLSEAIYGSHKQHQTINGECRYLANIGLIVRIKGDDGIIKNSLAALKAARLPLDFLPTT